MRAGRLKTRRYKVRQGGRGWIVLLLVGAVLGTGAYFWRSGELSFFTAPAPTLTPEESAADERTLTLSGQTWYTLQLGVFEQQGAAQELAESYRGRGAGGYVAGNAPYRVLAAAYESRADAQAVQNQLRTLHGVEAYVAEIARNEITLRVTGQKAQLTALEDAYDTLDQAARQLASLSQGLDNRELEADAVREAVRSQRTTVSALAQRLRLLFGEAPHAAVSGLMNLLSELSSALETAAGASGETRLGAQVKYCQLLCIVRMADYAAGLAR